MRHSNGHEGSAAPQSGTRRLQRAWYRLSLGRWLLDMERAQLAEFLPNLFGYHALQIGSLTDADLLASSRITHRVVLVSDLEGSGKVAPGAYSRPDALPVATDSVDVVLLAHTLEFEADPHGVLREAERVLIPEGHVVILGFNPWSLWGLWRLVLMRSGRPPWCGRFLSLLRIKDWLALLGFEVVVQRPFFFRPPLRHPGIMQRLGFMEKLGARTWPAWGGAYLLLAKKRIATLTPIKPRWESTRRLVPVRMPETSAGKVRHDD